MSPPSPRYTHIAHPAGVLLVDQWTGELTLVPQEGTSLRCLRPPCTAATDDPAILAEADEITRTQPLPIAVSYARVLAARDPSLRCAAIVECFSIALKYWTLVLLHEYLLTAYAHPPLDGLLHNWRRPLTSDWGHALERVLRALTEARREPFVAGFREAYARIERAKEVREPRRSHPGDFARPRESAPESPLRVLLEFRNAMAHEPLPRSGRATDLALRYERVLRRLLRETACVARHPLHVRLRDGAILRLMGAAPTPADPRAFEAVEGGAPEGVFLLAPEGARVLSLEHPFEFLGTSASDGEFLMLESFDDSTLTYHSLSGETVHRTWDDHPWRRRLATRVLRVQLPRVGWESLLEHAARATEAHVARLLRAGHLPPDLLVETPALVALERFVLEPVDATRAGPLHLTGVRGVGRSAALVWLAHRLLRRSAVFVTSSSSWTTPAECVEALLLTLGARPATYTLATLFERLHDTVPDPGGRVVVLIDDTDVDGTSRQREFLSRLFEPLAVRHRWLRVVLVCRDAPTGARSLDVVPFDREGVVAAYERLQVHTRLNDAGELELASSPTTSSRVLFHLAPDLRRSLSLPLTLAMLCRRYHQRPLPVSLLPEAIGALKVEAMDDGGTGQRRRAAAALLARAMRSRRTTSLSGRDLDDLGDLAAYAAPHRHAEGAHGVVAELCNEGILTAVAPATEPRWAFADPKVLEALVVSEIYQPDAPPPHWRLWHLAFEWRGVGALEGALVTLLVRLCHDGHSGILIRAIDEVTDEPRPPFLLAASLCLDRLAVTEFEGLDVMLDAMALQPTPNDLDVLAGTVRSVLPRAPVSSLASLARAMAAVAAAVSPSSIRASHRVEHFRLLRALGEADARAVIPESVQREADVARVLRAECETPRSREEADALVAFVGDTPRDSAWADARLARAQIAINEDDWDDARRWCDLVLGGASDARDRLRAELLLQWVGFRAEDPGAFQTERVVARAEGVGHLDLLRQAISYRAIEMFARGSYREAAEHEGRAVELARRQGRQAPVFAALRNLGWFRLATGDLSGAHAAFQEAFDLSMRRGRRDVACRVLVGLAVVALEEDDRAACAAWIDRSLALETHDDGARLARWLQWCVDPTPEHAARWRAATSTSPERLLLRAQRGAIALEEALAHETPSELITRFTAIADALKVGPWRREMIDLPLATASRLARHLDRLGAAEEARRVIDQGVVWADGRPSRWLDRSG